MQLTCRQLQFSSKVTHFLAVGIASTVTQHTVPVLCGTGWQLLQMQKQLSVLRPTLHFVKTIVVSLPFPAWFAPSDSDAAQSKPLHIPCARTNK